MNPTLRPIEIHSIHRNGQPELALRDSLGLTDKMVVLPQALAPMLALCDGSRGVTELHAALLVRAGLSLPHALIEQVIDHLDAALLLDNERFAQAYAEALRAYRAAPFRPPALAGSSYPADPEQLRQLLEGYLAQIGGSPGQPAPVGPPPGDGRDAAAVVGLVSPHIDYQRGGRVYASVWSQAAAAARAAELAIIFGTDHNGGNGRLTLTRQSYATPYGVLPTAEEVVEAVAAAIGHDQAFTEEFHHRREHSVELAAVWLHHMRSGQPCPVLPILCGSFQHFVDQKLDPADDPKLGAVLEALRQATAGRQVLVVAAADLAHVGPAFHDPFVIDYVRYLHLQAADDILLQTLLQPDAAAFFRVIAAEGNRRNVCGLPPIYLLLRLLGPHTSGQLTGYERCPADGDNTSFVSVCGAVFRGQS
jgi:hypothetical protein